MNTKILIIIIIVLGLLLLLLSFLLLKKQPVIKNNEKSQTTTEESSLNLNNFYGLGGVADATCSLTTCRSNEYLTNSNMCAPCPEGTVPDTTTGTPALMCKSPCDSFSIYVTDSSGNKICQKCGNGQTANTSTNTCVDMCGPNDIYITDSLGNKKCSNCLGPDGSLVYLKPNNDKTACVRKCDTLDKSYYDFSTNSCIDPPAVPKFSNLPVSQTNPLIPKIVYGNDNKPEDACNFDGMTYFDTGFATNSLTKTNLTKYAACKQCSSPLVAGGNNGSLLNSSSCGSCSFNQKRDLITITDPQNSQNKYNLYSCVDCGSRLKRSQDGLSCVNLCDDPTKVAKWGTVDVPNTITCSDCPETGSTITGVNVGQYLYPLSYLNTKRPNKSIDPDPLKCGWTAYFDGEYWDSNKSSSWTEQNNIKTCSPNTDPTKDNYKIPNSTRTRCKDYCDEEIIDSNGISTLKPIQTKVYIGATKSCFDCNDDTKVDGYNGNQSGPGWIKDSSNPGKCMFACDISKNNYYNKENGACACCPVGQFPIFTISNPNGGRGGWYSCKSCEQYQFYNGTECLYVRLPFLLNKIKNPNGGTIISVNNIPTSSVYKYPSVDPYKNSNGIFTDKFVSLGLSSNEYITSITWGQKTINIINVRNLSTGNIRSVFPTSGQTNPSQISDRPLANLVENLSYGLVAIFTAVFSSGNWYTCNGMVTVYRRSDVPYDGINDDPTLYKVYYSTPNPSVIDQYYNIYGVIGSIDKNIVSADNSINLPVSGVKLSDFRKWASLSYPSTTTTTDTPTLSSPYNVDPISLVIKRGNLGFLNSFDIAYNNDGFCGVQGGQVNIIRTLPTTIATGNVRCDYVDSFSMLLTTPTPIRGVVGIKDFSLNDNTTLNTILTANGGLMYPRTKGSTYPVIIKVNNILKTNPSLNSAADTTFTLKTLFTAAGLLSSTITSVSQLGGIQRISFQNINDSSNSVEMNIII